VDSNYFSITAQLRDKPNYSIEAVVGPPQKTSEGSTPEGVNSGDLVMLSWREK